MTDDSLKIAESTLDTLHDQGERIHKLIDMYNYCTEVFKNVLTSKSYKHSIVKQTENDNESYHEPKTKLKQLLELNIKINETLRDHNEKLKQLTLKDG